MYHTLVSSRHPRCIALGVIGAVGLGVAVLTASFAASHLAFAQEREAEPAHAHDMTDIWDIARGGQLYDNWAAVLEQEAPAQTHPAYPAAGKQKGKGTWRCKECHGWDYRGKDGSYAKGSHYTGIKGVRGVAGMEPAEIHKIIMNKTHGMTEAMMPHSAMEKLALFLSRGQIDTERYIDRKTAVARGNTRRGAQFYQSICAVCHGFDGRDLNFGSEEKPEFVGTIGQANPWEGLHKVRFGQPGVGMVALNVLEIDDLIDILAYIQTLPAK